MGQALTDGDEKVSSPPLTSPAGSPTKTGSKPLDPSQWKVVHLTGPEMIARRNKGPARLPYPMSLEMFQLLPNILQENIVMRELWRAQQEGLFLDLPESTIDVYLEWTCWWCDKNMKERNDEIMKLRKRSEASRGMAGGVDTMSGKAGM
ncbi:hypothetical protein KIPB_015576 [Kipferlia bialata]|uniref:Uncharacterized protein n=1 Tax=Kipferlia bialata TaxID=797122 RepID=A0A9K3GQB1_9EUKA|nr:hypothetical protein KIPB_015576 [Kipferlia bialata]|eukprot:g15576.t1